MGITTAFLLMVVTSGLMCYPTKEGSAIEDIINVNEQTTGLMHVMDIDVKKTPEQMAMMKGDIKNGLTKKSKNLRWPGAELHFTIESGFEQPQIDLIREATKEIEKHTCIVMTEHSLGSTPKDYVSVFPGSGCWSYVGRIRNKQQLSLQIPGCIYKGTIMHEFLHALGVQHEQSRADRDGYVGINWANIWDGLDYNFEKEDTDSLGVEYDPNSVMHYSNKAFSTNNQDTIYWKKDPSLRLGGRELTPKDIKQLNLFYECDGPVTTKPTTTKKRTTKSTTKRPVIVTGCGDKEFKCVSAYHSPKHHCEDSFYKNNCRQSCNQCDGGDEIQCGNFKDNEEFDCYGKSMKGHCTINIYKARYNMKKNCPQSCCLEGRLYF